MSIHYFFFPSSQSFHKFCELICLLFKLFSIHRASCEEHSWTPCVRVKYFLSFVWNLPSASFIKDSLVLCIWGEKMEKSSLFSPCHSGFDTSLYMMLYSPSVPVFVDWSVLVSLAIDYTEVALVLFDFFFSFHISHSLFSLQFCNILFEMEGPKYAAVFRIQLYHGHVFPVLKIFYICLRTWGFWATRCPRNLCIMVHSFARSLLALPLCWMCLCQGTCDHRAQNRRMLLANFPTW